MLWALAQGWRVPEPDHMALRPLHRLWWPVTHWRNAVGTMVAVCGERGLNLKFSINEKRIDCPDCVERRRAGAESRRARFEKAADARRRG